MNITEDTHALRFNILTFKSDFVVCISFVLNKQIFVVKEIL